MTESVLSASMVRASNDPQEQAQTPGVHPEQTMARQIDDIHMTLVLIDDRAIGNINRRYVGSKPWYHSSALQDRFEATATGVQPDCQPRAARQSI